MGRREPARSTTEIVEGDRPGIDRREVLEPLSINAYPKNFEELADAAQVVAAELFMNQAAICLKLQQDYMASAKPMQAKDEFSILKQLSEILRHLTAFEIRSDPNRAIESLERLGYTISASDTREQSPLE